MRGQKQCQDFLWLFLRSLPLDYNRKMQISRTHIVSTNFSHSPAPAASGSSLSWVGSPGCTNTCVTAQLRELCSAEQPENRLSAGRKRVSINILFHTGWGIPQNDDRNKSLCLDSLGSTGSDLPWSTESALTAPTNISLLHSTSLLSEH